MEMVVGVRFRNVGKIYYFNPKNYKVKVGDHVIVETARGVECGEVVQGVLELESAQARSLNGTPLFTTWKVMAVADILAYLLLFIPGLNVICIIVRFVFGVVFLVHLNRTRKAYECPPAIF